MPGRIHGLVACSVLVAAWRPCAAFAPSLARLPAGGLRAPALARGPAKPATLRRSATATTTMLGVDLSVPLALAQVTNDILAAPGAAYSWYLGALDTDALAVDTATASALYALGVVTSSAISNKWEPDMTRHVAKWAALGVADGFCTHSWYGFIQGVANSVEMPRAAEALAMTVTSSTLYTPVYCTGFLVLLSLLEGKGVSGAVERTRLDFQELVWKTTKVWGKFTLNLGALFMLANHPSAGSRIDVDRAHQLSPLRPCAPPRAHRCVDGNPLRLLGRTCVVGCSHPRETLDAVCRRSRHSRGRECKRGPATEDGHRLRSSRERFARRRGHRPSHPRRMSRHASSAAAALCVCGPVANIAPRLGLFIAGLFISFIHLQDRRPHCFAGFGIAPLR
jgi:hypothetical protein